MKKYTLKQTAISLRKSGHSYEFIAKKLNLSKSTSYTWLKNTNINNTAKNQLIRAQILGRKRGLKQIQYKRKLNHEKILSSVKIEVSHLELNQNVFKLLCSFLYWGEGEKTSQRLAFTNSDPVMVKTFLVLFRKAFPVMESKFSAFLHLHDYHVPQTQISFWSKITGIHKSRIKVYNKPSNHKYSKSGYPGCISVRYHDANLAKIITAFYTEFAKQHGGFV